MRTIERLVCVSMVLSAMGCGGASGDPDGAASLDAGPGQDAQVPLDAGQDGGSDPSDAGMPCPSGCEEDEACVHGTCVASCGAALSLEGALAEGLVVVANVCRTVSGPFDVVVGEDGTIRIYDLASETSGTTTTLTLSRWTLDPAVRSPAVEVVATATHEVPAMDVATFASGYVEVSPDETRALFGYTTSEDFGTSVGGVFDVEVGDGTATEVQAVGNFDAAWVDDARWIVSGLGLEGAKGSGQGLWVRDVAGATGARLVGEMGSYSGSVAIVGDVIVASGVEGFGTMWPDGSTGERVFVIDRDAALAAATPVSAWDGALERLEGPSAWELLAGDRLASARYDDAFAIEAIEARTLVETLEGWALAEPIDLTHGPAITAVASLPGDRLLMVHAGGVLVVEE